MWIQAVAIILPRIQQHYAGEANRWNIITRDFQSTSVPDSYIGAISSSMFAGMMIGAVGWGTCKPIFILINSSFNSASYKGSDLMGRSTAFNATLFFTAIFGIMASFSNSFFTLCIALFFLGSSVGVGHFERRLYYLLTYPSPPLFFLGLNANRRHPLARTFAERKAVPCNSPFRFLLIWRRAISTRRSFCRPAKFLFPQRSSSLWRRHPKPRVEVSSYHTCHDSTCSNRSVIHLDAAWANVNLATPSYLFVFT